MENKAVIFTHFSHLSHEESSHDFRVKADRLVDTYTPVIRSYMECNKGKERIGIVYAYVDWAIKKTVTNPYTIEQNGKIDLQVSSEILVQEKELFDVLERAKEQALSEVMRKDGEFYYPINFVFVGLDKLLGFLRNIVEVRPNLLTLLFGPEKTFGYDSPKFVEAIIRLARQDVYYLARHPVIRVDEDAQVHPDSIDLLLDTFREIHSKRLYFFFSGRYGRFDGRPDPLNDHPVRVHWFYPPGATVDKLDDLKEYSKVSRRFLADVSFLGGTQYLSHKGSLEEEIVKNCSKHMQMLIREKKVPGNPRPSEQVVSGAGLIMSSRAITLLPPFMNFKLTTWVDDNNKRLMHEMLEDIAKGDKESIPEAIFQQSRHGEKGLSKEYIENKTENYLERLLRGCMFHSMIATIEGKPTEYSKMVRDIVLGKTDELSEERIAKVKEAIEGIAREKMQIVLDCWGASDYERKDPDNPNEKEQEQFISYSWAKSLNVDEKRKDRLVENLVEEAMQYLEVVKHWPIFVSSVKRLSFIGNDWLYKRVD